MIRWQPLKLGGKSSDTKVTKVLVSQVGRGWPWLAIGQMLLILIHHITTPPDIDTDTSLSSVGFSSYNRSDGIKLPSGHCSSLDFHNHDKYD